MSGLEWFLYILVIACGGAGLAYGVITRGLVLAEPAGNERMQTIHASVLSVNTALDELATWDLAHRRELLDQSSSREEFIAKQAAYDDKFGRIQEARVIVYKALTIAATQTDTPSLAAALDAVKALLDSIVTLKGGT